MALPRDIAASRLERLLDEIDARNADNVVRTDSYLELYALTRTHPPELPWLLMAHLVSRNAGYLMTSVAEALERDDRIFRAEALSELFLFLERANFLIFYDAWHHVIHHLLGRSQELAAGRTPRFIREAWSRYERERHERNLVLDLVENEQNYIERRVVHHQRFAAARALVRFTEHLERDAPLVFPGSEAAIRVGEFASLAHRIAAGRRIFDEVLADPRRREALYEWARKTPHTGSRADHGGRAGPALRSVWPLDRVRTLDAAIHAPPEPDPHWP